jgi:hypothetical protein
VREEFDRRIVRVTYSKAMDRVRIIFNDRTIYVVPRRLIEGLENAAALALRRIEIVDDGPTLHWPLLGVKHRVPKLLKGEYGSARWMASLDRTPKESSRHLMRVAEKAVAAQRRGLLGDELAVMTNASAKVARPRTGSKERA